MRIGRRRFLSIAGAGILAGLGYYFFGWPRKPPFECPKDSISEYRVLGRTGYEVSILTIGGCGPGTASDPDLAIQAFECAINNGINMVDIAPTYGQAEARLGPLVSKYRDRLVVAEKTQERTREGALAELNQSLSRLGVEYFDIYQFHQVGSFEELDQIFGENGAMETFLEARDSGKIRHIGITAHEDMRVVLEALRRFDFDTIMIPINSGALIQPSPENDFRPILEVARDRDAGVMAIKAIVRRRWQDGQTRTYRTWYEPLEEQEDIDRALWFTLSQKGVATCPLACDIQLWEKTIKAGARFKELDEDSQAEAVRYLGNKGVRPLFPVE